MKNQRGFGLIGIIVALALLGGVLAFYNYGFKLNINSNTSVSINKSKKGTIARSSLACTELAVPPDGSPVNTCTGTIVVKTEEDESKTFLVSNKTKLTTGGEGQDLSQLAQIEKSGTPVEVEHDGTNNALTISY